MSAAEEDERLGQLFRLLRRRGGLTQEDLSVATDIPIRDIRRLESGLAGAVELHRIRRLYAEVGGRARLSVWWNGAAADRLLDEEHAAIGDLSVGILVRRRWDPHVEFTFSEFGERGSIDVFATRESHLAVAVCEIKNAFGSLEDLNRSLDVKVRLAPKLCREAFGWSPRHIGRLLVVPDNSSIRRMVARHSATLDLLYPVRGRPVRTWLRKPDASISGIWFLSNPRNTLIGITTRP